MPPFSIPHLSTFQSDILEYAKARLWHGAGRAVFRPRIDSISNVFVLLVQILGCSNGEQDSSRNRRKSGRWSDGHSAPYFGYILHR